MSADSARVGAGRLTQLFHRTGRLAQNNQKCLRWRIGRNISPVALILFFIYMLLPFRWQEHFVIAELTEPASLDTGLVFTKISVWDVGLVLLALYHCAAKLPRIAARHGVFVVYICINIASFFSLMWARYRGLEAELYLDGLVETVRVGALYILYNSMAGDEESRVTILLALLAVLFLTTGVLYFAGYNHIGLANNEARRFNVPGLEVTSASYMALVLSMCGLTCYRGWVRVGLLSVGVLGLLLTGGRIALILFCLGVGIFLLSRRPLAAAKVLGGGMLLVACCAPLVVLNFQWLLSFPVFNRSADEAAQPTPTVSRIAYENLGRVAAVGEHINVAGRLNAWGSGVEVAKHVYGRPLGSDWHVQEHLADAGYYTHTHSTYLQTYLKYGLLAAPFWFMFARSIVRGYLRGAPVALILTLLALGWVVDYWLFMTKAGLTFFALLQLNERVIRAKSPST